MTPMLSSSIELSKFLAAEHKTSSVIGNVNFIESSNGGEAVPICYMPYLNPFSTGDGTPFSAIGVYEGLAAIFLAMEHLNTGNGTIVPELANIHQRCPLRFTTKAFDTELQPHVGVDHIITLTDRKEITSKGELLPCALLGAGSSSVSLPSSIISGIRGFPQISPISTSSALDNVDQHPLFGRTIPNDDGTVIPLLSKLTSWGVKYLAVIHIDNSYGNSFAEGIRLAAQIEAPDLRVETVDIPDGADDESIAEAIKQLKDTGFTYFFGIVFPEDVVNSVMTEAYKQGIAGTGVHNWLFSDGVGSTATRRQFAAGSPLERAYRGSGVLSAKGGVPGINAYDKLSLSMQQLKENDEDLSFLVSQLPQDYPDGKSVNHTIVTSDESFLKAPGLIAPFAYDAVVALGLAACRLVSVPEMKNSFTGIELFDAFVDTTFDGASGSVVMDPETGTRDPRSAFFSLTNFVEDEEASVSQGNVKFKGVESALYKSGDWETIEPYTFNDDTNNIPVDLPYLETNPNYLSAGWKVVGLMLCGTIVALVIGFSLWTYCNSKNYVVRASQPFFLYIISFGTLIMGLSIIPLTIDLGVTDQEGADAACMSFPWLIAIGFSLTFSALFTKTYRINQIMRSSARFRRLKLTAVDVIKPMLILLALNVIVLTVWSVIDPLQRNTVVVSEDGFGRDLETFGVCSSDHGGIFIAVLCVTNLGSLLFAIVQAYQARNISTELQESNYIFMAMALILLVSFIGVPVLVIARDNTSAYYFVTAGVIFVVCSSILLLIFVPKIQALRRTQQGATGVRITDWPGLQATGRTGFLPTGSADSSTNSGDSGGGLRLANTTQIRLDLETENKLLRKENAHNQEQIATLSRRHLSLVPREKNGNAQNSRGECFEEE